MKTNKNHAKLVVQDIRVYSVVNLNRGDDGNAKSLYFGGYERTRQSSQNRKHSMKVYFGENDVNSVMNTKYLHRLIKDKLVVQGLNEKKAESLAKQVVHGVEKEVKEEAKKKNTSPPIDNIYGFKIDKDNRTKVLINCSTDEIDCIVNYLVENIAEIDTKLNADQVKVVKAIIKDPSNKALGQSLFGRFMADTPCNIIDGSCAVSHPFAVNALEGNTFDYYAAVDTLQDTYGDGQGAAHLDYNQFTCPILFGTSTLNLPEFFANLGGDLKKFEDGVSLFLEAYIKAVSTSKINSTNPSYDPDFIFASVQTQGQPQLCNSAFTEVVRGRKIPMIDEAVQRFVQQYNRLSVANKGFCLFDTQCYYNNTSITEGLENYNKHDSYCDLINEITQNAIKVITNE